MLVEQLGLAPGQRLELAAPARTGGGGDDNAGARAFRGPQCIDDHQRRELRDQALLQGGREHRARRGDRAQRGKRIGPVAPIFLGTRLQPVGERQGEGIADNEDAACTDALHFIERQIGLELGSREQRQRAAFQQMDHRGKLPRTVHQRAQEQQRRCARRMLGADPHSLGDLFGKAGGDQRRGARRALPHADAECAPGLVHRPHHCLGHPRRAACGGEEQRLRVIMHRECARQIGRAQRRPVVAPDIHRHCAIGHCVARGAGKVAFGEQRLQPEAGKDVRQFALPVMVVHIDRHHAGLDAAEIGEQVIGGVAQHLSGNVAGLQPARGEPCGDAIGDGIKLAPADHPRPMHQRRPIRRDRSRQSLEHHPEIRP